jgi:hypothetical protein
MKSIKLSLTILAISLFLMACNSNQPQTATGDPLPVVSPLTDITTGDDEYWAKDNFDLQRVGNLLERSNSPQEFETYLNDDDGLNNLDLNGDGYVDYISVDEFEDRGDGERGLSLFSRFGPDLIQEIATIVFYRDDYNSPGARVLMTGNDQIYGDNYYYESNWVDRSIGLVTTLFGNRDSYYRSPYYYDNYPDDYVLYEVVEPSFYRTRVERLYPQPVFVYTAAPVYITKIKIKSPHKGKWMNKVHAKLAKPNKEQLEFKKNNPGKPAFVKVDKGNKGEKPDKGEKTDDSSKSDKQPKDDRKTQGESAKPGKPAKADDPNAEKGQGEGKGGGQGKGKKP